MIDFASKCVVVTGGASGLGAACARAFHATGANVIIGDIDTEHASLISQDLGERFLSIDCDVSKEEDCDRLVASARETFGEVDVLINNAGVGALGSVLDLETSEFDRVMNINLRAYFVLSQKIAQTMVDAGRRGSIINMSSIAQDLAIGEILSYVTSKGGVKSLTRAAALSLAPYGIRVNAIAPGTIATERQIAALDASPELQKNVLARTPLGRTGEPKEVADTALFLASEMAGYITGQTILVDGGRSVLNYTMDYTAPIKKRS